MYMICIVSWVGQKNEDSGALIPTSTMSLGCISPGTLSVLLIPQGPSALGSYEGFMIVIAPLLVAKACC